MKKFILLILPLIFFISSCASTKKEIVKESIDNELYTVKVVNTSIDKVLLRYQKEDLGYTFQFVDKNSELKFLMNGNLIIQYSQLEYDNAKIFKIKQDTFIHVKENDIIVDDLPIADKITPKNKVLEKSK
ncbi:MAG: hypothetical protein U0354_16195 [Candidatus Sericytochromatia bacterium]